MTGLDGGYAQAIRVGDVPVTAGPTRAGFSPARTHSSEVRVVEDRGRIEDAATSKCDIDRTHAPSMNTGGSGLHRCPGFVHERGAEHRHGMKDCRGPQLV